MWKIVARLVPSGGVAQKIVLAGILAGIAGGAFFCGWQTALAQTRGPAKDIEQPFSFSRTSSTGSDNAKRIVAQIHESIPLSREEFGEYLINRVGNDRIEAFVNRRILEVECQRRGIYVTDAEVQAQLNDELKSLGAGVTEKEFTNQILKRFNKSLFEWKEDVIRPRIALTKMVQGQAVVAPDELQKAFEARFGEKVKVRMIVLEKNNTRWSQIYEAVKNSEEKFIIEAKSQFIPGLASLGGEVPPIHKHFGDQRIEREAFMLKTGEVSSVFEMPDGTRVILKCDGRIPADNTARFDEHRMKIHEELRAQKINQMIPEHFKQLKEIARVQVYFNGQLSQDQLERQTQKLLNPQARNDVKGQLPADQRPQVTKAEDVPPALNPIDPSKLQGPPADAIRDINDLDKKPVSPPGTFVIPAGPPPMTSSIGPVSEINPTAPPKILQPSPTTGFTTK